jgi:hypothetical protein
MRVFFRSVRRSLVTANVVPSSPILVTLMMEALSSSETSVLTRATRHNIADDILQEVNCLTYTKCWLTFCSGGCVTTDGQSASLAGYQASITLKISDF